MPFFGSLKTISSLSRTVSGSVGASGRLTKKVYKNLYGTINNLSGSLFFGGAITRNLAGTIEGFSSTLTKVAFLGRNLSGVVSSSGEIQKKVATSKLGSVGFNGALTPTYIRHVKLAGTLGILSGSLGAVHIEGEPVELKGLYRLGNSLRLR